MLGGWINIAFTGLVVGLTCIAILASQRKQKKRSVIIKEDGEDVIRAGYYPDSLIKKPPGVSTMHDSFLQVVEKHGNNPCVGTRQKGKGKDEWGKYEWKTYKQLKLRSDKFASGLVELGAKPGDCIGIFSKNREEWLVTQQACFSQSLVIVSFYETLGKDSIRYVAEHAEIGLAVVNGESLPKILEVVAGRKGKGIKNIVVMDPFGDEERKRSEEVGVTLHLFTDVEKMGENYPAQPHPPAAKDLCTIMYTSGTTGTPKGVPLTHENFTSELAAIMKAYSFGPDIRYLSYLPLAHIFERVIILACLHVGAHVGFFHGDTQAIVDDVKVLKPTLFVGVPKVYDKAKHAILKKVSEQSIVSRAVFRTAFLLKKFSLLYAQWLPLGFLDKLVFNKTKEGLGGKVELMISAGAPLSYQSELFLRICFGVPVCQAYGLTETCGASTFKLPNDPTIGCLGGPMPCNECKLVDLKDMGYTTQDKPNPRGELCIRGYNLPSSYYKDEEKTKESFIDGWFYTGDIVELTENGEFRIVDRKKNMLKLAQGEYVAVEKVEEALVNGCDLVDQIFVYGDSEQSTLIAVVVPKKGAVKGDLESKETRTEVAKKILDAGKQQGLQGFEIPRSIWLTDENFTPENDLMTPTMKLKRQALEKKFKEQIKQLYVEAGNAEK